MPVSPIRLMRICIVSLLLGVIAPSALATQYFTLEGARQVGPVSVSPGARYVLLAGDSGPETVTLGGHNVALLGASAMIGSSSDALFVAVVKGEVQLGELSAGPGEALLIEPYGRPPTLVAFDAERMAAMFGPQPPSSLSGFAEDLASIADSQSWDIFFGLYRRSVLDLQNPGGARTEGARASVMGAPEVVRIRYSGQSDPDAIEEMVVARAAAALAGRDANALAQLLDPAPYGGDDLQGGGQEARLLVAKQLVDQFSRAASREVRRGAGEGVWRAGSVTLRTRPYSDFVFISAVE